MNQPVVPRPAATISIVRDVAGGFEVLMMQRTHSAGFMPGAYVFPGGAIDREDRDPELYALCSGIDDAAASRALGLERDGLAYWIGAIRECFEEAGLLLCYDAAGELVRFEHAETEARFAAHRDSLNAGKVTFADFCRAEHLRLAADRLTYFSHWITPVAAPKRYDTRFFAAIAPQHQQPLHDAQELIDTVWVRPAEALERDRAGTLSLRTPTIATLHQFDAAQDCAGLLCTLGSQKEIRAILPAIGADGGRVLPGEPGYAEAASNPEPKWS
ncbi:MAG: NUDIX hydrolase [Burkholderiales bacterium]